VLGVSGLRVVGTPTVVSSLGGAAPRTMVLRLRIPSSSPVVPVLVGRRGKGPSPSTAIEMPTVASLGPGQSRELRVPFQLSAFSVGDYTVQVQMEVLEEGRDVVVSATTSQWPIAWRPAPWGCWGCWGCWCC